jgi:hypothetical protein
MYFRPSGLTGDREIDEHLSIARGAETT